MDWKICRDKYFNYTIKYLKSIVTKDVLIGDTKILLNNLVNEMNILFNSNEYQMRDQKYIDIVNSIKKLCENYKLKVQNK